MIAKFRPRSRDHRELGHMQLAEEHGTSSFRAIDDCGIRVVDTNCTPRAFGKIEDRSSEMPSGNCVSIAL
jgi:hypothetical protein